jgi:hypothetical protein
MNRTVYRFFSFAFMIGLLILALKVMNWLPLAFQQDAVRRYKTIEEVRSALNMKDIYVPSYFPQQISWPPAAILAQSKPFSALVMEFTRADKRNTALTISQSEGAALNVENPIEIRVVTEKVQYSLKGRNAILTVGSCAKDEPCSGITWTEGTYTMTVLMKSTPFELTKIVESMLR